MLGVDVYSATLGLALAAAIAAVGSALLRRHRRAAAGLGVVALVLVSVAGLYHRTVGHAGGTASALGPAAFLGEHPALSVTAAAAVAAIVLARRGRAET